MLRYRICPALDADDAPIVTFDDYERPRLTLRLGPVWDDDFEALRSAPFDAFGEVFDIPALPLHPDRIPTTLAEQIAAELTRRGLPARSTGFGGVRVTKVPVVADDDLFVAPMIATEAIELVNETIVTCRSALEDEVQHRRAVTDPDEIRRHLLDALERMCPRHQSRREGLRNASRMYFNQRYLSPRLFEILRAAGVFSE